MYSFFRLIYNLFLPPIRRFFFICPKPLKFVSNDFGFSRGKPFDRYYIERFLSRESELITGSCLEFGSTLYLDRFLAHGAGSKSTFIYSSNICEQTATYLKGDLLNYRQLPPGLYDCILCTNVLNFIYDFQSALAGIQHLLASGGVVLLTVAGPTAHISRYDMNRWGDYWRFTDRSLLLAVERAGFVVSKITCYGNPYSCASQALGYSVEDHQLFVDEPNHVDYQILIAAVLKKP